MTTWATIKRADEIISQTDPFGNVTTKKYDTGLPYAQTETAECAVIYRQEASDDERTTAMTADVNGTPTDVIYHYAEQDAVDVRTYRGKIHKNGEWVLGSEVPNVWSIPINSVSRYPQGYAEANWDSLSFCGCYMQRLSDSSTSEFNLKNALQYEVVVGYNVYNASYNIQTDRLTDSGW